MGERILQVVNESSRVIASFKKVYKRILLSLESALKDLIQILKCSES